MTEEQLAAIERRAARFCDVHPPIVGEQIAEPWITDVGTPSARTARELLSIAQDDVPALLAEVRELREELARVQADFERYYRAAGGTL